MTEARRVKRLEEEALVVRQMLNLGDDTVLDPAAVDRGQLTIAGCPCGRPECCSFTVVLTKPMLFEFPECPGELASTVFVSVNAAQAIVDHIRNLCRVRGVTVV